MKRGTLDRAQEQETEAKNVDSLVGKLWIMGQGGSNLHQHSYVPM